MKQEQDYIRDIAEMRTMMERSTKFLSLSGLAGVMAGVYALCGAYIAYKLLDFNPGENVYSANPASLSFRLPDIILLAIVVLILAVGTAILLSYRKANKRHEKFYNPTAKRLMVSMGVPLITGGLLILILIANGLIGFIAPFSLIFYGLALFNAAKLTYGEVKSLGLLEIVLGLLGCYFPGYGLLFWALGFGVLHIIYGIYMHYKYER